MLQNIRLSPEERRAAKERSDLILKEFRGCLPDLDRDTFDSVPDRFKKIWMLAYQQRTPKGAALVKAKCLDCCCWQPDEITNCTSKMCALWPYRPYRKD